jgi:hypothetical protein
VEVYCRQKSVWPELLVQSRIDQHGSDKVVQALNHPLSMAILLVDVGC